MRDAMAHTLTQTTLHGLPVLHIQTPRCSAALSLYGGQLLSFVPAGGRDVLWVSPLATGAPGAIRGGVPVCWPYFGKEHQPSDVPQHGFARNTPWQLEEPREDGDGNLHLALTLPVHDSTPLRLRQTLVLGTALQQALTTHNPSDAKISITQALHSYFAVGDVRQVRLEGLDGLDYDDKYSGKTFTQAGDWTLADPRDPGRSDRIYHAAGGHYVLHDPALQRRLRITTTGSHAVVVWNPGEAGAQAMADVPDARWHDFVCVEAANAARDLATLAPGGTHTLAQAVEVLPAT
jgi:glucose-6-phosphate 1-epimerase